MCNEPRRQNPTAVWRSPGDGDRRRAARAAAFALVAVLCATLAAALAPPSLNRLADGDFEAGFVGLVLPAIERFPLVANGWAARGPMVPEVVADPEVAFEGDHALRLVSRGDQPLHVLQDVPLGARGFEIELAFRIDRGSQALRLYSEWGRDDPGRGVAALELWLASGELEVATRALRTRVDAAIGLGTWHVLRVVADPRAEVQTVWLDGRPLLSVPGTPPSPPRTLILGDRGDGIDSEVLWDAISIASLAELELADLRGGIQLRLSPETSPWLSDRLDAAARALGRGAPALALPELRAARRQLTGRAADLLRRGASGPRATGEDLRALLAALDDLVALLETELE